MATVAQFDQDPDQQNQPGQNAGGGGQVLNSTGGSGTPSSGAGGGSYSAPRQQQSTTPNISQYLAANQGAGQQLASGITSNVQNQANQLNQNVNTAQNTLNNQYQGLNQNLGDQGQQNIQTAFQNPQALLDSYNAAKTQSSSAPLSSDQQNSLNQYNQFQNLNTGGYNQGISNYGTSANQASNSLQNQYQNLAQQTGSAGNEMGRFDLLRNTVGQPGYNQGQQTLDDLFLQAQPGVANQLKQNLGQIGTQAQQQVQGLNTDTQSKLAALQGLSSQDQQMIQNLFTNGGAGRTGLNQISSNVGNEYKAEQTALPTQQAAYQTAFQNNQFTPEQLQQLGLKAGQNTWGVDVQTAGNYQSPALLAANAGGNAQVATPEEFARYNALNQLAGGPAGTAQQSIFGSAPTAGGGLAPTFDTNALNNAIATKQAAYGNDVSNHLKDTLANLNQTTNWLQQLQNQGGSNNPAFDYRQQIQNESNLNNQLQSLQQQGKLDPATANNLMKSQMGSFATDYSGLTNAGAPRDPTADLQNFLNYYSGTYLPAANAQVGTSNAIPQEVPMNGNNVGKL